MNKLRLFAVLGVVSALVTGCSSLFGSSEPAPAKTPEDRYEKVLKDEYGLPIGEAVREIEDETEILEATAKIGGCDVEFEMVLGEQPIHVAELHVRNPETKKVEEPDWPEPRPANLKLADIEKLLNSRPPAMRKYIDWCLK